MGFTKTKEKAKDAAESAGYAAREVTAATKTGITESRETAAKVLERAATGVRGTTKKAARTLDSYGSSVADRTETAAARVRPEAGAKRGPVGYARRHPMRTLLLFGLVAGIVAVFWIRRTASQPYDEYDGTY